MTITVIVHALEAVLGLLVVALGYRVARQYRYDCSDTELLSSKSSSEVLHTHDKVSAVANVVVKGSQSTTAAVSNDPELASKPSSILDDYIGGFSMEPTWLIQVLNRSELWMSMRRRAYLARRATKVLM